MFRFRLFAAFFCIALALCFLGLGSVQSQSGLRRITNTTEEGKSLNPSLSGDGRIVAFESTEDLAQAGGGDHFRALRADVSNDPPSFTQMGGSRAVAPAVSQDGSRIAFAARDNPLGTNLDGNSEIFLFDNGTLRQLTNTSPGQIENRVVNGNFQPSISDDGRFIAFASNRDLVGLNADGNLEIFVYDVATQSFTQLTNSLGTVGASDAKISGNGARVAFIRDGGASPSTRRDLMIQDRTGALAQLIAGNVDGLALTYGRAISDDGTRVVYAALTAPSSSQVFLFDGRSGNQSRPITFLGSRTTDVPLHPTISGDGSRIAFATRRSVLPNNTDSGVDLYTFDVPTGQTARVTNGPATATADVVSSLNDQGTLIAFNYPRVLSGEVTFTDDANNTEIYLTATAARPAFGQLTVLNGASFGHEPATIKAVAPNSIAVGIGGALANSVEQAQRQQDGTFPRNVGGTTVTVNGRAAQIFFVSPTQVNFLVPPETEVGNADVVITNSDGFETRGTVAVLKAAPGIFTFTGDGRGEGVVLDADTLQPGPFDPSNGQRRLIVFATGARNATQISVNIGGRFVTVESVVASPNLPGMDEIHLLLPADLRGAGTVEMVVRADNRDSNPVTVTITGEARRDLVINEVLADPPDTIAGDANHDGVRDTSQDEFVEIVNTTTSDIDISGYELLTRGTTDTLRHKFASNTILPAGGAIVVFGGGNFDASNPVFGGAQVVKASTGGLSLVNGGGVVTLRDPSGAVASLFSYGGSTGLNGDANQSLTRSPDVTGNFTGHLSADGNGGRAFSPGTRVDGSPFLSPAIARIEVTPPAATIFAGQHQQFTAHAFDAGGQELSGVIFIWQSSNTAVATIDQTGNAAGVSEGTTEIRASARGVQSAPAVLAVNFVARVLTRIEVTPNPASIPVSGGQQFTASAFDQFGNPMTGVTFSWASADTNIATIDQTGLALGVGQGQTTINASAQNVQGSAVLNVTAPTVVINEVLADPPGSASTDLTGDANHDGVRSGADDEFVELVNSTGAGLSISGWTLRTRATGSTTETVRHTFVANTTLPAGEALVVFGGGSFDPLNPAFACAQVVKASTGGLSLTNSGLTLIVRDSAGNIVTQFTYGTGTSLAGDNDQSLTRAPDITGGFVQHTTANGASGRRFSPGARVNGSPFGPCPSHLTSVSISPPSSSVNIGQSTQFTAQALDQFGNALTGTTITFASDNTNVATVDSVTTDPNTGVSTATVTGHNPGTANITAQSTDGTTTVTSTQATLTVNATTLIVAEDDVVINEFVVNPSVGKEYVELLVTKPGGVDMRGWTLSDVDTRAGSTTSTEGDITLPSVAYLSNVPQGTFVVIVLRAPSANTNSLAEDTSTGDGNRQLVLIAGVTTGLVTGGTLDLILNENLQLYGPGGRATGRVVDQVLVGSNTSYIFAPDGTTVQATFGDNNGATTSDNINGSSGLSSDSDVSFCPTADALSQFQNNDTGARFTATTNSYGTPGQRNSCVASDTSVGGPAPALVINISGKVTDTNGNGIGGVTITVDLEHGSTTDTRTTLTDSNGNYSFTNLPGGQDRVFVTPSKDGLTFNPSRVAFVSSGSVSGDFTANFTGSTSTGTLPTITISDSALSEGNSGTRNVGFTVTLSEASTQTVTVDFATASAQASSGVATPDTDYQSRSGTLIFNPGVLSRTIVVPFIGDTLVEPNETFFVNLSNPTNAFINDSQAVGTIINDDTANLAISQIYGGGGNVGAPFTNDFIEIFNRGTTTVDLAGWSVQYNAATDTDAWAVTPLCASGPCLIAPGHYFLVREGAGGTTNLPAPDAVGTIAMTTATGKVALVSNTTPLTGSCPFAGTSIADRVGYGSLSTTPDFCFEGSGPAPAPSNTTADFREAGGCTDTNNNAADFFVFAPNPRNSSSPVNNCSGGSTPNLTINDVTVTEGNSGTVTATFTVSLSAPANGADVTFDIATQDNTATTANSDYVARTLTNQIIPAGQQTFTFSVTVNGDLNVEPDEQFFVNVTNVTGATVTDGQGVGTIQNDDLPSLSINDVTQNEGNSGGTTFTFTVHLSAPAPAGVTFDIATQDNTATVADNDYAAKSLTTQTIPAGQQDYSFAVTVNGDLNIEPNETFLVNVTNVTGATASDAQGLGTIQNDDTPALTVSDVSRSEGNTGATTFSFNVHLSLPAPAGGVTFDIATADGTAQDDVPPSEDNDYVAKSLTGQTIPEGSQDYTFDVTVNGDTVVEPDETFFVNLSNPSANAAINDGQGQGTITNDDTANLVISQVYGGGGLTTATFTNDFVEIFNRGTTTVNFAVTPYSIQYAGPTSNFGAANTTIVINSGTIAPGKYFLVQGASGGAVGGSLPTPDATGNINLAATAGKVALVVGTTAVSATSCPGDDLSTAPTNPSANNIVDFVGYGATATCYEGPTGPAPAPSNTTADFRKAGGCTDTDNNSADFFVLTPNPRNSGSPANNCSAPTTPNLTIDDVTVAEGNSGTVTATFTVSLSAPASGADVTFDISTQNNTAIAGTTGDYTARTLTNQIIPAGQQTYTFAVTVRGDTTLEADETFFVNVTNVAGATVVDGQGVGTIQNDDFPTLSINDVSLNEGNSGATTFTFTVSLSATAAAPVSFDIATADGTAQDGVPVGEDTDYVSKTETGRTIAAGQQTATFTVTVNGDTNIESDETFLVNVTNVTGATVTDGQGTGTIQNDDSPAISINDVSLSEGNSGTTSFTFNVSLSTSSTQTVTVNYATADNTAVAPGDYTAIPSTLLSFAPGETSKPVTVLVNGDLTPEGNETFFVNLSGQTNATIADAQGVGTITNDDAAVTSADLSVSKADSPDPVAIGNDITYTITVTNGGADTAINAVLSDTVPTNTTFRSITAPAGWTCPTQPAVGGTGAISCTNPSFAVESSIFTLVVRVNAATASGTTISNTASVSSDTTDSNSSNDSATTTTTTRLPLLVISQIYTTGGAASAAYNTDYIEIFNRDSVSINLSGFSVQYANSTTGTFTVIASLPNITLAPRQYFLIQAGTSNASIGAALPVTPDQTGSSTNMTGSSGKVAIVVGTAALTSSNVNNPPLTVGNTVPGCPTNASIVIDFVGYGTTASCFEGTGRAPDPTTTNNSQSDFRNNGGCTDSNDNQADFTKANALPRNSSTIKASCP